MLSEDTDYTVKIHQIYMRSLSPKVILSTLSYQSHFWTVIRHLSHVQDFVTGLFSVKPVKQPSVSHISNLNSPVLLKDVI